PYFYPILEKSREVYDLTQGAFDPTVGPLVNSWGFGNKKIEKKPAPDQIDSLQQLVGFDRIRFDQDSVKKDQANIELNFSAIAKGYAIDVVGQFLEDQQIENYLVEIGREVRCKGINAENQTWTIGIINPLYKEVGQKKLQAMVKLDNRSLASSGNYENYWEEDEKKYAHIIDPQTGYPVTHSLLSASVFAPDCMSADAYATAFIVMGLEKAQAMIKERPELDAFLIYADEKGNLQTYTSEGIKEFFY
ncbi:MAG: FAD:protein FMN transferase, partial [Bacteroidota bacterium]